jgi:hypothetical protein
MIAELEAERDRLESAIAALLGSQSRRGMTASVKPDRQKTASVGSST